jgi:hypothetical protein
VTFNVTGSGLVTPQVDTALLQERLAGRTLEDAQRYLQTEVALAQGTTPQIVISPDFLGSLPLLSARIEIIVLEDAS